MDMTTISAAVGSLQSAAAIAKGLIGIRDATVIQGKVIELQSAILAAQSSALAAQSDQFSLIEKARDLERQITELEAWNAEKERYELHEYKPGIFTRRRKAGMENGEITHDLCATCFESQRKSPLQRQKVEQRRAALLCPACKTSLTFYD